MVDGRTDGTVTDDGKTHGVNDGDHETGGVWYSIVGTIDGIWVVGMI